MTFSITAAGTVEQARAMVEAAKTFERNEQFDEVKAFILGQLSNAKSVAFGDYINGVLVEANGHDGTYSAPYVKLEIRPLTMPSDKAKAEVSE